MLASCCEICKCKRLIICLRTFTYVTKGFCLISILTSFLKTFAERRASFQSIKRVATIGLCTGHEEVRLCRAQTCSQESGGRPGTSNPETCCQKTLQQRTAAAETEWSEDESEEQLSHESHELFWKRNILNLITFRGRERGSSRGASRDGATPAARSTAAGLAGSVLDLCQDEDGLMVGAKKPEFTKPSGAGSAVMAQPVEGALARSPLRVLPGPLWTSWSRPSILFLLSPSGISLDSGRQQFHQSVLDEPHYYHYYY